MKTQDEYCVTVEKEKVQAMNESSLKFRRRYQIRPSAENTMVLNSPGGDTIQMKLGNYGKRPTLLQSSKAKRKKYTRCSSQGNLIENYSSDIPKLKMINPSKQPVNGFPNLRFYNTDRDRSQTDIFWQTMTKQILNHQDGNHEKNLQLMITKYYDKKDASTYVLKGYTYGVPIKAHGNSYSFKRKCDNYELKLLNQLTTNQIPISRQSSNSQLSPSKASDCSDDKEHKEHIQDLKFGQMNTQYNITPPRRPSLTQNTMLPDKRSSTPLQIQDGARGVSSRSHTSSVSVNGQKKIDSQPSCATSKLQQRTDDSGLKRDSTIRQNTEYDSFGADAQAKLPIRLNTQKAGVSFGLRKSGMKNKCGSAAKKKEQMQHFQTTFSFGEPQSPGMAEQITALQVNTNKVGQSILSTGMNTPSKISNTSVNPYLERRGKFIKMNAVKLKRDLSASPKPPEMTPEQKAKLQQEERIKILKTGKLDQLNSKPKQKKKERRKSINVQKAKLAAHELDQEAIIQERKHQLTMKLKLNGERQEMSSKEHKIIQYKIHNELRRINNVSRQRVQTIKGPTQIILNENGDKVQIEPDNHRVLSNQSSRANRPTRPHTASSGLQHSAFRNKKTSIQVLPDKHIQKPSPFRRNKSTQPSRPNEHDSDTSIGLNQKLSFSRGIHNTQAQTDTDLQRTAPQTLVSRNNNILNTHNMSNQDYQQVTDYQGFAIKSTQMFNSNQCRSRSSQGSQNNDDLENIDKKTIVLAHNVDQIQKPKIKPNFRETIQQLNKSLPIEDKILLNDLKHRRYDSRNDFTNTGTTKQTRNSPNKKSSSLVVRPGLCKTPIGSRSRDTNSKFFLDKRFSAQTMIGTTTAGSSMRNHQHLNPDLKQMQPPSKAYKYPELASQYGQEIQALRQEKEQMQEFETEKAQIMIERKKVMNKYTDNLFQTD